MTLYKRLYKHNPRRTYEAMTRRLRHMKSNGWARDKEECLKQLRVGYLDIEATNLNGNYGFMLSWYIKKQGKNETRITLFSGSRVGQTACSVNCSGKLF